MAEVSTPIEVNFVLGPETERRLMESIVTAFTRAFAAAGEVVDKKFAAFGEDLKVGFKTAEQAASKTANEMERMDSALMSLIHGITIEASGAISAMKEIKFSAGETIAATNKASKLTGKVITQSTQTMTDAARLEVEQIRATSAAHSVDTQRRMVQEKQAAELIAQTQKETAKATLATHAAAAKRRMIITQEMFHTLTRLEKAFGATVAGIAKTMTSALSKAFSGLGSVVSSVMRRHNTTIESEMRRTASTVESGMRKTNAEFTDGLSPALSKREAMMRSSFADQEKIVKRSAVRQAAAIETLQKETRTGVVGAANRGLNIGAFLGGAAIFTAARSTFKVGSEFVRGLAVLQSQLDLTGEQMKTVRELSIQLGNDITLPGVSALDAAEAIQILTKQFGSLGPAAVDAAEAAAKGTLQLSRAAGVGAEDAAQVIGSAINVFKIGADQAVTVADTVAGALAKAAGVSFSDFKDSFVQGATVFEQFVGPVEAANDVLLDFNTTLAVLAKNGITGSNAGAGLKQFFLQATKSSPKAQKVSAELAAKIGESGNIFFTATGKARKYDDALRILRAGLKGLTDEQRNSTLATLFGSRSITIASALINTTQEDYDNLRKSIQKQGLAAKIAAAQNTGFAGALDALMSVVETAQILLFEELNPILGKVTLAFATFFTNILNGKGVWEIIRRGLLGVAAGLGAVLAVKGVIELFGLLETALTLVLTPMGTFLLAAAAIGAAISILDDQSALFRQALKEVEHRLGQLVKQGLKLAETGLANLGDIIARDVIPFVSHLAKVVGEGLVRAFEATSRFVTDKVIPAFARMWAFIRDKVVPIIERVGKVVGEGFVKAFHLAVQFIHNTLIPALGDLVDFLTGSVYPAIFGIGAAFGPTGLAIATVVNTIIFFWDTIKPILLPAIEGFKTLGDAIRTAFVTGNFADVGAGFAAAGTGIMAVLRRIGGMIVDVLEGAFHTVVATMKRVFSLPNLINAGKGFLDFVEFIGNTIGKIVTDPRFLGALAAIALALGAAAALIAFRFLEGFTKAFLHNLKPNLMLLAAALIAGLMGMWKLVFSNPGMTALVISGLLAVFKARSLIRGMTAAGEESGRGFFTGFFKSTKASAQKSTLLFKSLFDGQAFTKYAQDQSFKAGKAMVKEFGRNNALLRAAGQDMIKIPFGRMGVVTQAMADDAKERVRVIKKGLGEVGTAALESRAKVQSMISVFKGIGTAISGIGPTFKKAQANGVGLFASLKTSFQTAAQEMKRIALTEGTSIGRVIGAAVAKGAMAAVLAAGGFQAGKAEGEGGGSGLMSALLGGLTAGMVTGDPLIGVAVGGFALLGAAMGRATKKAKEFNEEVKKSGDIIRNDLMNAIETGVLRLQDMNFANILGTGDIKKNLGTQIADAMSPAQRKVVADTGLKISEILTMLSDAHGDVDKFSKNWTNRFLNNAITTDRFGDKAEKVRDVLKQIAAPGDEATIKDFLSNRTFSDDAIVKVIRANQDYLESTIGVVNVAHTEAEAIAKAVSEQEDYVAITADVTKAHKDVTTSSNGVVDSTDALVAGMGGVIAAMQEAKVKGGVAFAELVKGGASVEDALKAIEDQGLQPPPPEQVSAWQTAIGKVKGVLDTISTKLEAIPGLFSTVVSAAVTAVTGIGAATPVDAAIVDAGSVAGAVQDAVVEQGLKPITGDAAYKLALDGITTSLGSAISTAVASGMNFDDPTVALPFIDNVRKAMIEGLDPNAPGFEAAKAGINGIFANLPPLKPIIDEENALLQAQVFQTAVQDYLTNNPLSTTVEANFAVFTATHAATPGEHGFAPGQIGDPANAPKAFLDKLGIPTPAQAQEATKPVGVALTKGIQVGMNDPEAKKALKATVDAIVHDAKTWAMRAAGARSPSKEFAEVGMFMSQGLALGIESGAQVATDAARTLAQSAVDAAHGVMGKGSLFGGDNPAGFVSRVGRGQSAGGSGAVTELTGVARSLVTTAQALTERGPDVTNVAITEAANARHTARATIAELRADRLLQKGLR